MNIEFFSNRTRLLAAGLCGAAVLTFAGLETQTAQAQEDPEPMKPADANQEQDETVIKESENKQTIGRLDLSSVQFEGEILRDFDWTEQCSKETVIPFYIADGLGLLERDGGSVGVRLWPSRVV